MNGKDDNRSGAASERAELEAFMTGVREALARGSGLVVDRQKVSGRDVFVCLYPPAVIAPDVFGAWARATSIQLGPDSRFLTREDVEQAARRFGLAPAR
jgi:hypothetical protein